MNNENKHTTILPDGSAFSVVSFPLPTDHWLYEDELGERWAELNDVPCERFKADWNKLGRKAGVLRNQQMAENAHALIAVWDGNSPGTRDMIDRANRLRLRVYVHHVATPDSASPTSPTEAESE